MLCNVERARLLQPMVFHLQHTGCTFGGRKRRYAEYGFSTRCNSTNFSVEEMSDLFRRGIHGTCFLCTAIDIQAVQSVVKFSFGGVICPTGKDSSPSEERESCIFCVQGAVVQRTFVFGTLVFLFRGVFLWRAGTVVAAWRLSPAPNKSACKNGPHSARLSFNRGWGLLLVNKIILRWLGLFFGERDLFWKLVSAFRRQSFDRRGWSSFHERSFFFCRP